MKTVQRARWTVDLGNNLRSASEKQTHASPKLLSGNADVDSACLSKRYLNSSMAPSSLSKLVVTNAPAKQPVVPTTISHLRQIFQSSQRIAQSSERPRKTIFSQT